MKLVERIPCSISGASGRLGINASRTPRCLERNTLCRQVVVVIRVAVVQVTTECGFDAGTEAHHDAAVRGSTDVNILTLDLVRQGNGVTQTREFGLEPILDLTLLYGVVVGAVLRENRAPVIRERTIISAETQDGLTEGLQVHGIFFISVFSDNKFERADKVAFH